MDIEPSHSQSENLKSQAVIRLERTASDAGASAVLANQILQKTLRVVSEGMNELRLMLEFAKRVQLSSADLSASSNQIKRVAQQSKIVSINAGIEANRAGEHGRTFKVVAHQMTSLSEDVRELTATIDIKLDEMKNATNQTSEKCQTLENIFGKIDYELKEFQMLMSRLENLSHTQLENIALI